jgi:hypothetical protein
MNTTLESLELGTSVHLTNDNSDLWLKLCTKTHKDTLGQLSLSR